jgi:hypothetical protein
MPIGYTKVGVAGLGFIAASVGAQNLYTGRGPEFYVSPTSSEAEATDLQRWIGQTSAVLGSTEFARNIGLIVDANKDVSLGGSVAKQSVLEQLIRDDGSPYRYHRTAITLVGDQNDASAFTGHVGEQSNGTFTIASRLGRRHLARFRSTDPVERSCAINTMAHEMSHTIVNHPTWSQYVLEDGTGVGGATPIASYVIGTVAQCTYLESLGRIPKAGLANCVAAFGKSEFFNNRCGNYAAGQEVKP